VFAFKHFRTIGSDSDNICGKTGWGGKRNLPNEVKDTINTQMAERFAAKAIEIPFPQMEVRRKNNHPPLQRVKDVYD
jgi:hypothetical protein